LALHFRARTLVVLNDSPLVAFLDNLIPRRSRLSVLAGYSRVLDRHSGLVVVNIRFPVVVDGVSRLLTMAKGKWFPFMPPFKVPR